MLNLPKECQSQRYPPPLPFPPLERKLHPPCNTPLHSIFEARHHRPLKFPEYLPINHHPLPSPPFRGFPPPPLRVARPFFSVQPGGGTRRCVPFGSVQKPRFACAGISDLRPQARLLISLGETSRLEKTRARVLSRARRGHRGYPPSVGHAVGSSSWPGRIRPPSDGNEMGSILGNVPLFRMSW